MNRYDSYRDTGLEWVKYVPKDWECLKIKRVYELVTEKSIPNKNDKKISPECVTSFFGTITNFHSKHGEVGVKFIENDVLFNKLGVKVHKLFHSTFEGYSMGEMIVLRSKKNTISKFLYYQLTRNEFIEYCDKISEGVTLKRVGVNDILDHYITNPPTSEQQQIVSFLDTKTSLIDSLIEKTQQKIELLKEKRTSLINEVVTKGLNPNVEMKDSGVEWIGEIPSHWEFTRIKYFVNFDSGYSFKSEDYSENGIPLIRIGSLYNNTLSFERSPIFLPEEFERDYNQFVIEKNDVLISMTGTLGKRDYGYSILYNENFPSLLNQRVGRIRLSSDCVNLNYLMYYLLSEPFLLQLFSKPTGTKQGNLSSDDIIGNYFGIPTLNEQQQIVEYLDEQTQLIDNTMSIEEKRIELLKEYRQSLISEVVTGKRKVVE